MYSRLLEAPRKSFFLFGPRGTGKSSWVKQQLPGALYFDLLDSVTYLELLASPRRLGERIPTNHRDWVVLDEVQKVPAVLDEVHRLIETRKLRFALTGSSARKLKSKGVNLLAGRAHTRQMHPLTAAELGGDFDLARSLRCGLLPSVHDGFDPRTAESYLKSYVQTYLREEVQQEGLTRNVAAFSRFLEAASFSQGSTLNISAVARDAHVERKLVESYFDILEDLLLGVRVPVFAKRAKRDIVAHPRFFLFDCGVFRAIRPRGPLDVDAELEGPALETLLFQHLRAHNDYGEHGYTLHYWRTRTGREVDFVLYGERGLLAFEVKRASRLRDEDFSALEAFCEDYPVAKAHLVYGGSRAYNKGRIRVWPAAELLPQLGAVL